MINKITLILALCCAPFCTFAQHSTTVELDSLIGWLDNHIHISKDSTLVYKTAHKALKLSRESSREKTLAN